MKISEHSFGGWIKRRRKALDLTQQELARKVGCSLSLIFKIESDERRPSRQIAALLAEHLQIPEDQRGPFLEAARQYKVVERLESPWEVSAAGRMHRGSLPAPPNPLVGRDHELATVLSLVRDPQCRLLTLTGPGGMGKTRLAIEAGHRLIPTFTDGVFFVELAGVSSAEYVIPAIAETQGLSLSGSAPPKMQLLNVLRQKELLLILDNMEHLLEAGPFLAELLQDAVGTKLLATSREPLHVQAEWTFEVMGLPVPEEDQIGDSGFGSASALFVQRAMQARADFLVGQADGPEIVRICRMLEGLPLAIELAASWIRVLSCSEISAELARGIDILTASDRDRPERHRSMTAVLDHSWNLLTPMDRQYLRGLAVFRGGFARQAAQYVSGVSLKSLSGLVDKSLVRRSESGRFDLHELTRQYALEKLEQSGEMVQARSRHFAYFLQYASDAEARLSGPEQIAWLDRLETDHDNLRAALEWAVEFGESNGGPRGTEALALAGTLYQFWRRRTYWSEGREWLRRALAAPAAMEGSAARARAVNAAALLAVEQTDTVSAIRLAQENLALSRKLDDPAISAAAQYTLGMVLWKQKKYAEAHGQCKVALELYRELGDRHGMLDSLHALGHIAVNQSDYGAAAAFLKESRYLASETENPIGFAEAQGDLGLVAYLERDFERAESHLEDCLERFRLAGYLPGIESTLNRLGDLARCRGDYHRAGELYAESLHLYRKTNDLDEIASLLHNLGQVARHDGDYPGALAHFREGLEIQVRGTNPAGIAECLAGVAAVLCAQGRLLQGARLLAAAETLRESAGAALWPANQMEYDSLMTDLHASLDKEALDTAWHQGRQMTLDEALAQVALPN